MIFIWMIFKINMYLDGQFSIAILSMADGIWCFYRRSELVNNGLAFIIAYAGRVKDKQNYVV